MWRVAEHTRIGSITRITSSSLSFEEPPTLAWYYPLHAAQRSLGTASGK